MFKNAFSPLPNPPRPFAGFSLDSRGRFIVLPDGSSVTTSYCEGRIFAVLLSNRGAAASRKQIYVEAFESLGVPKSRSIDQHVRSLRKKLGVYAPNILTIYGFGYCLLPIRR